MKAKNIFTVSNYNCTFEGLGKGTNYFHLKMVDADGQFNYSNVVTLIGNCGNQMVISPIPVKGTLYMHGLQSGSSVVIFNNLGQQMTKLAPVTFDNDSRSVDVSKYTRGNYFIRIVKNNKTVISSKVIKL